MEPDDRLESTVLTIGVVKEPGALLAVAIIVAAAWLVMTSYDLATPVAWTYGK